MNNIVFRTRYTKSCPIEFEPAVLQPMRLEMQRYCYLQGKSQALTALQSAPVGHEANLYLQSSTRSMALIVGRRTSHAPSSNGLMNDAREDLLLG